MTQELSEPQVVEEPGGLAGSRRRREAAGDSRARLAWLGAPTILLGLILGLSLLAYRRLLFWDPSTPGLPDTVWFFFGPTDTAPQVVFALATALVVRRRRRLAETVAGRPATGLALPLLLLGFVAFLWGQHVDSSDLVLGSFLPFALGSALFVGGSSFARSLALPILFLGFAVPPPGALLNQLLFPLQLWTATHTAWLLGVLGIPTVLEGDMLYLPGSTFEVIETCSGLRSIQVLTMLAFAFVGFFPVRPWHGALLLASAPAIAYVINAGRVTSLVLNPESEVSTMHAVQGVVMFLAGVALLCGIDAVLRRCFGDPPVLPRLPSRQASPEADAGLRRRGLLLAATLLAMLGASIWLPRWQPPPAKPGAKAELPEEIAGWHAGETPELDRHFFGRVGYTKQWQQRYERGRESVVVFVGYDDRLQPHRSLLSPKNALPGRGWEVESRDVLELAPGGRRVDAVVARSGAQRRLIVHWYEETGGWVAETLRAWLALDRSPLRRSGGAKVVRLHTELDSRPWDRRRAEARLRHLSTSLAPHLSRLPAGVAPAGAALP